MHKNLLAYEDYEKFSSNDVEKRYKLNKLEQAKKNVSFIDRLNQGKVSVLELGSGNSKFLYALALADKLEAGVGIEVSQDRHDFAEKWRKELDCNSVTNLFWDALTLPSYVFDNKKYDITYCVDLAFQFFDPVSPGSDLEVLNKMFEATKIGGHIVLELDTHNRLISKMENNKLKTRQSFEDPDPWEFLLWDCEQHENTIEINKTFINRRSMKRSKSSVVLKNYSRGDIISLLERVGFKNCFIEECWQESGDLLEDEFIVVGERV